MQSEAQSNDQEPAEQNEEGGEMGKPRHPSLMQRVANLEVGIANLHAGMQRLMAAEAALLTAMGYPALAREFFGLEVKLPPKHTGGGVVLP